MVTSIHPQGEALKKAIQWVSEKRKGDPKANPAKWVDQASLQFDLSPKDSEFLLRFVRKENT